MAEIAHTEARDLAPLPHGWIRPIDANSIPAGTGVGSSLVFLAMPGGAVKIGSCLYRPRGATYTAPVHAWFALDSEGRSVQLDVDPIAWRPLVLPQHPLEA